MSKDKTGNRNYPNYGVAFGLFSGTLLAALLQFFFNTQLVWNIVPRVGTLVGLIIGIAMRENQNK